MIIVMPCCGEIAHEPQHLVDELGVERGGDLVEEQHLRLHRHRARDRDALLLAAAELVGVGARPFRPSPTRLQQRAGALLGCRVARGRRS